MSLPPIVYRPLLGWTDVRKGARASGGQFRTSWPDAQKHLRSEAEKLGASLVVIQLMVPESALRKDETGFLRGGSDRVQHPGVVVSLDTKHGPMRLASDRYVNSWSYGLKSWQANVRAITLTLEALRGIDRWGVSQRAEQYAGWVAIESTATAMPAKSAAEVIAEYAGWARTPVAPVDLLVAWRVAKRRTHPDAPGGSREAWDAVQAAARDLGLDR